MNVAMLWSAYHCALCMALLVLGLCQQAHSCIKPSLHGLNFFLEIFLWRFSISGWLQAISKHQLWIFWLSKPYRYLHVCPNKLGASHVQLNRIFGTNFVMKVIKNYIIRWRTTSTCTLWSSQHVATNWLCAEECVFLEWIKRHFFIFL